MPVRVLAAPDKFKGTATATEVAQAISDAVEKLGATCKQVPLADGGEGTLDALGGANRQTMVSGPLGDPVHAGWQLRKGRAVIEMAAASGLLLVGGAEGNDPLAASTYGTGELITAALDAGAKEIIVGVGGSATTDGGLGALRAMFPTHRLKGVRLTVACDVRITFVDAAQMFATQKGASPAQVLLLERRLQRLVQTYVQDHGVDVSGIEGGGAAGGLAGGLAAVGAEVVSGFEVVADALGFFDALAEADLVITGEGFVDEGSFDGKVVGGVVGAAAELGVPVLVVAGQVFDHVDDRVQCLSLRERFGEARAWADPLGCVGDVLARELPELLARFPAC